MDVKKCSKLPPPACKNALHSFWMVAAVAKMYLSSIAALISSIAVMKSSMDVGLTLQTWGLTHPRSCRGCNQENAEAKRPLIVTKFLLLWASSGKFRSSEQWAVVPSCCQHGLDQWQINCFQSDQIMSRSLKVLVTSMLICPLLPSSISQPAPSHP